MNGEYWRLLPPGQYQMAVAPPDSIDGAQLSYRPVTVAPCTGPGSSSRQDFYVWPTFISTSFFKVHFVFFSLSCQPFLFYSFPPPPPTHFNPYFVRRWHWLKLLNNWARSQPKNWCLERLVGSFLEAFPHLGHIQVVNQLPSLRICDILLKNRACATKTRLYVNNAMTLHCPLLLLLFLTLVLIRNAQLIPRLDIEACSLSS